MRELLLLLFVCSVPCDAAQSYWEADGLGTALQWSVTMPGSDRARDMEQLLVGRDGHGRPQLRLQDADGSAVHLRWPLPTTRLKTPEAAGFSCDDRTGVEAVVEIGGEAHACRRIRWYRRQPQDGEEAAPDGSGFQPTTDTPGDVLTLYLGSLQSTSVCAVIAEDDAALLLPPGCLEVRWLRATTAGRIRVIRKVHEAAAMRDIDGAAVRVTTWSHIVQRELGMAGWTTVERATLLVSDAVPGRLVAWRQEEVDGGRRSSSRFRYRPRRLELLGWHRRPRIDPSALRRGIVAGAPVAIERGWTGHPVGTWRVKVEVVESATGEREGSWDLRQVLGLRPAGRLIVQQSRRAKWNSAHEALALLEPEQLGTEGIGMVAVTHDGDWPARIGRLALVDPAQTGEADSSRAVAALGGEHPCQVVRYASGDGRCHMQLLVPEDAGLRQRLADNGLEWLQFVSEMLEDSGGGRTQTLLTCQRLGLADARGQRPGAVLGLEHSRSTDYQTSEETGVVIVDPAVPGRVLGEQRIGAERSTTWVIAAHGGIDDPVPSCDGRAVMLLEPYCAVPGPRHPLAPLSAGTRLVHDLIIRSGDSTVRRRIATCLDGHDWFGRPQLTRLMETDSGYVLLATEASSAAQSFDHPGLEQAGLPARDLELDGVTYRCQGRRHHGRIGMDAWDVSVWLCPELDLPYREHRIGEARIALDPATVVLEGTVSNPQMTLILQRRLERRVAEWGLEAPLSALVWRETWSTVITTDADEDAQISQAGTQYLGSAPTGVVAEHIRSSGTPARPDSVTRRFVPDVSDAGFARPPLLVPGRCQYEWTIADGSCAPLSTEQNGQVISVLGPDPTCPSGVSQPTHLPRAVPCPRAVAGRYRLEQEGERTVSWQEREVVATVRKYVDAVGRQQLVLTCIDAADIPAVPWRVGDWAVLLPRGCIAADLQVVRSQASMVDMFGDDTWRARRRLGEAIRQREALGHEWRVRTDRTEHFRYLAETDEEELQSTVVRELALDHPGLVVAYERSVVCEEDTLYFRGRHDAPSGTCVLVEWDRYDP